MIVRIDPHELPGAARNRLYLDYVSGAGAAADFFAHSPLDFCAALKQRQNHSYPRREVSHRLAEYNTRLGARPHALANIEALRDPSTFCVIAGQQAGFLGGPAYTVYKIVTTMRLAAYLEETLPAHFVPLFWLASDDHDFNEINHAYYVQGDGEVGQVRFDWDQERRPIADLPVTEEVTRAYGDYFESIPAGPCFSQVEQRFAPQPEEDYATWHARIWSQLFSERGLVIVEPRVIRPLAPDFFRFALKQSDEIAHRLDEVSHRLEAAGYAPELTSGHAGQLYTFDRAGQRVRVEDPGEHVAEARVRPGLYSTDAALRPLFADRVLPVVVSVLGPGETAYQGMLRPLYDLFDLPQPLLFPRKSYTVVAERQAERLAEYQTSAAAILTGQLDMDAAFRSVAPASEYELFASARSEIEAALSPLRSFVESIDPSLGTTWAQTVASSKRNVEKLEGRALRAQMSQLGFSKGELRRLRNGLLPRGRLQERVFPLPHFMNLHGMRFIEALFSAGELADFSHHILTLEDGHESG